VVRDIKKPSNCLNGILEIISLDQCYCWQVAPQQSLLPLHIDTLKLIVLGLTVKFIFTLFPSAPLPHYLISKKPLGGQGMLLWIPP